MNLFKIESYRRGIAVSSAFNFIAKIVAFANSIVIAFYFGTQGKTDVYFYSFATISLISAFLTNLNGLILIPESMRIREQEGLLKSMHFLNWFMYIFLFIGIVFTLVLYINPVKSFIFFSKFDSQLLHDNVQILFYVTPMLTLVVISSLLTEILVSFKYFTLPMIAGMINSLLSIVFVAVFHARLDILSITTGLLAGFGLNILILIYLLRKQLNWDFRIKKIKIRKLVFKNIFYAQAGNITTVLGTYIPLYLISGFNQGVVTALNYGRNLSTIPDQLITTQFSSIFGIKLNEVFASREYSRSNDIFLSSINMLFFILIPVSLIMSFFSSEIVTILYLRGKFDKNSVEQTSQFLKYFSLALPFLALNTLSSRIITASQKISVNFYVGVILNSFYLVMLYFFIKLLGPPGYPIALLSFLPLSTFLVNYFIFKRILPELKYYTVILIFSKILLFNFIVSLPFAYLYKYLISNLNFSMPLSVFIACFFFICSSLFLNNIIIINKDVIYFQKRILKTF